MQLEDLPTPAPGAGQVLLEVKAAGVNLFDTQLRSGLYKRDLPLMLGQEGAGVVAAVGDDVTDFAPGDRVAWIFAGGSYGTHTVASVSHVVPLPDAISFEDAAAVLFQGLTAHYLATSTYSLEPGSSCLVHSAAGGCGILLCQIGKIRGAQVIGAVSTPAKAEIAREAGADHVVVYAQEDFEAAVKRITGGRGVDVVYDAVGLDTYVRSMNALRPRGLLALYGEASGLVPPIDPRIALPHADRPRPLHRRPRRTSRPRRRYFQVGGGRQAQAEDLPDLQARRSRRRPSRDRVAGHGRQAADRSMTTPTPTIAPRLPLVETPEDAPTREQFAKLAAGNGILNLHRMMAHAPALMKASGDLAFVFRRDTVMPRALVELVIMRTAQVLASDYIWARHVPLALASCVTETQIGHLARWPHSSAFTPAEKAALSFAEKAALRLPVPDDDFAALRQHYSPRAIVEIAMLVGNYVSTAIFIQALAVPPEQA